MKKFRFSLDTVLSYKQQILDNLRGEYAACVDAVRQQEEQLERMWNRYRDFNAEFRHRSEEGLPITDAIFYESGLRALERSIQIETRKLEELQQKAEEKREEMVEARKDTASLEKLREHKLDDYNKVVAKSEEAFIEEFVSQTYQAAGNA